MKKENKITTTILLTGLTTTFITIWLYLQDIKPILAILSTSLIITAFIYFLSYDNE